MIRTNFSRSFMIAITILALTIHYAPAGVADDLVALAGGKRVLIAFTDASNLGGWRMSTSQTLKGYDTDRGAEFSILGTQTNYSRPLISRDGQWVVYSNQAEVKSYRVKWDGSSKTLVADGYTGCLWHDNAGAKEYAIVALGATANGGSHEIWRVNLFDSNDKQKLLNSHNVTAEWMNISEDGSRIGGCWPWSTCGVFKTSDNSFTGYGGGCWPAMPYDNTYRFAIFNGAHTGWTVYSSPGNSHFINLQPTGVSAQVYHPKFASYNPSFVLVTAPGADCPGNLYVGKANAELTQVTSWITVIGTGRAGGCDLWIGGTAQSQTDVRITQFIATPASSVAGEPVMLSWQTSNATSVSIDNAVGSVDATGSIPVTPNVTTQYTLTAQGEGGPVTRTVTVEILALRDPDNAPDAGLNGLSYSYYEGTGWTSLPDFNAIQPIDTGISAGFSIDSYQREDNFAFVFEGYIHIEHNGLYTFSLISDDGSRLYIGNELVVENNEPVWQWSGSAPVEQSGTIGLKAGKHAIRVEYHEGIGGQMLDVYYEGPSIDKRIIDSSILFTSSGAPAITVLQPNGGETFQIGQPMQILYTADPGQVSGGIVIELSIDDGPWMIISGNTGIQFDDPSFGDFSFTLPAEILGTSLVSENARVRVRGYFDPYFPDESDEPFTIIDPSGVIVRNTLASSLIPAEIRPIPGGILVNPGMNPAHIVIYSLNGKIAAAGTIMHGRTATYALPGGGCYLVHVVNNAGQEVSYRINRY